MLLGSEVAQYRGGDIRVKTSSPWTRGFYYRRSTDAVWHIIRQLGQYHGRQVPTVRAVEL